MENIFSFKISFNIFSSIFSFFSVGFYILDELKSLLVDNDKFGFLIMDGRDSLFSMLQGNIKTIINKFKVDFPKKHDMAVN